MKCLPVRFDEAAARHQLARRRLVRLRRLFARGSSKTETLRKSAPNALLDEFVEITYLPHYLVNFSLLTSAAPRRAAVLVGAHEPTTSLWDVTQTEWSDTEGSSEFPPAVDPQRACELAGRLASSTLRRLTPGARNPLSLIFESIELIGYPYWAYYFHRRVGLFDVRLLDAVSGRPAGARLKVALLTALAARRDALAGATRIPLETVDTAT